VPVERLLENGWYDVIHPDDRARTVALYNECMVTGKMYEIEYRLLSGDGRFSWFLTRGVPIRDARGDVRKWIGTCTNIDEKRRGEESLRFLSQGSELLASSLDTEYTLRMLAHLVVGSFADWCSIYLFSDDGSLLAPVVVAHEDEHRASVARALLARYPHAPDTRLAALARSGRSQLLDDMSLVYDPASRPDIPEEFLAFARSLDLRSEITVPIVVRERTLGILHACTAESKRTLTQSDLRLAELLARRAAVAIDNATLYEEQRRTASRLGFMATASEALAHSLDLDATIATITRLPVPEFADWTMLDLIDENGRVVQSTAHHADPERRGLVADFARLTSPDLSGRHGRGRVLRTGASEIKEHVDDATLARIVDEAGISAEATARLHELGYRAAITVPIVVDGKLRGSLAAIRGSAAARYAKADIPIFEDLARRAATALANSENYTRESRASQIFQRAFLPTSLPQVPGVAFSAIYAPGEAEAQIGGDWYDAFPLPDGRIVVSIGDVTGRGLQAAVIMAKMRQSLETLTYFERDPARLLEAADVTLRRIDRDAIVTALVGVLDPARGTFSYATAGHPAPILCTPDGDMVKLPGRGLPLGLRGDFETPTTTVRLPDGALIVLFTDGLIEATHDILEGERRLDEALLDPSITGSDDPARAIQRRVLFDGSPDDVAILTLRYAAPSAVAVSATPTPQSEFSMHWSFDAREARASHDVRGVYVQYLRELAESGADVGGAELVFGELVSNVVRHAPGPIEIELEWTASQPVLHVLDRGQGFPRTNALPTDVMSESGRGLYLVHLLTEEFTVTTLPGYGTHARAVLPIRRGKA
jgi:GAF domain-containing protein/anti-sigma regulatory factor (Ser/Thr protein kinase)